MDVLDKPAVLHAPVTVVEGANFSGRSELLQQLAAAPPSSGRERNVYVGIDVHRYLSGLVHTVRGELDLHGINTSGRAAGARKLLESVGLEAALARNPLVLSGGEQVILALTTALLVTHDLLTVDCALEQLSPLIRTRVIEVLTDFGAQGIRTLLADNRLREFRHSVAVAAPADFAYIPTRKVPAPVSAVSLASVPAEPIDLDGVHFAYRGGPVVLRNQSFRFKPGQVCFLKGPNGVGKSTLCKILCGLLKPDRGKVLDVRGRELQPWRRPGHNVAYHFQNPDLQLFSTRVADEFAHDGLDVAVAFGLQQWLESHPHDLPFVLRKRVALAAALARRRPWIILDEPVLGQDDATAVTLATMLEQAVGAGAGVIVVTHSQWFQSLVQRSLVVHLEARSMSERTCSTRSAV